MNDNESWRLDARTNTLTVFDSGDTRATSLIVEQGTVRRLTPVEFERCQGFPDGWTATSWGKPQSDSARYKQLGNAVAVPVADWIAHRLVALS